MIDNRQQTIGKLKGYNFETITIADTAIGLTVSILNTKPEPKEAFVVIESAQCRYRYDGTDPTSSVGLPVNPMNNLRIKGITNLKTIKFIRTGSTNSKASVCYER